MTQLHNRFTDEQVKSLLERYLSGEIKSGYILEILGIKRARFFKLLKAYRDNPDTFSIQYGRRYSNRKIEKGIERAILKELRIERRLIEDKDTPLRAYNYSYIKDRLRDKYNQKVSLSTIIDRAKRNGFYFPKREKKTHDREVLTNYVGELIQHDASHHKWSPYADKKWYLITSLDDYSRMLLYAEFIERETSWDHILALESVLLNHGLPLSYYVDSHSIFRFVQGRDSFWRKHYKLTDEADPQWKQVLYDCRVNVTYALSPQAKGKIERPYGWLQDRIVRTCAREGIKSMKKAGEVLRYEVDRYNNHQVHSTTREIPVLRFQQALKNRKSLFREFTLFPPFESTKDIFCLRMNRTVNAYRKISINNLELKISGAPIGEKIGLRIVPDSKSGLVDIRFWHKHKLIDVQKVKKSDLNLVYF